MIDWKVLGPSEAGEPRRKAQGITEIYVEEAWENLRRLEKSASSFIRENGDFLNMNRSAYQWIKYYARNNGIRPGTLSDHDLVFTASILRVSALPWFSYEPLESLSVYSYTDEDGEIHRQLECSYALSFLLAVGIREVQKILGQ